MKCSIPEISWHNREPVLSVDLHPDFNSFYRLATGGGDCHVLIWQVIIENNGAVNQEVISDLKGHQRSVNVVKWSPSGTYLASGDDDANIIIWQLKTDNKPSLEEETNDKEKWIVFKILRGHKEDIYDLCWSPCGLKLLSGSIDNTAILWDVQKGKNEQIMTDHKGFVQGVAWDPKAQYIATISTDRICRIYESSGKHIRAKILKGILPVPSTHSLHEKEFKYFHDDTFKSFFRRLCFSPDGSILIVPSGLIAPEDGKTINCTYIFAVESNLPVAVLPLQKQSSTVVKCCPIYFELREEGPDPYINLPYRILFAIGTDHEVILYDTQQIAPFARFNNIHYTRLTDLSWSGDGLLLVASSTDGFCTLITFEHEELGVQYVKEESEAEESVFNSSTVSEQIESVVETSENPVKIKDVEKVSVNILTPKRAEKNPSILSFFKKTNQNKDNVELSDAQKSEELNLLNGEKLLVDTNRVNDGKILKCESDVGALSGENSINSEKVTSVMKSIESTYNVEAANKELPPTVVKKPRHITPKRVS